MSALTPHPDIKPVFGDEAMIRDYVKLGPIPVPGAPSYGAKILRLPTKAQVRRMLQRAAAADREDTEGAGE